MQGCELITGPDPWWQLEQRCARRRVRVELEQRSVEQQHEHRGASALGEFLKRTAYLALRLRPLKRTRIPRFCTNRKILQAGRSSSDCDRSTPPPNDDMKTYTNLFERIYSFDSLYRAYCRARLGKRQRVSVMLFEQNLEGNLIQLQNELIWDMYKTGNYHRFEVFEPKQREVAALPFRDRVVQHSLIAVIEPIWERRFIADSYACRKGRGLFNGTDRVQSMMRATLRKHGQLFALKLDVRKFFASIDHSVIKKLLRQRIGCERTLALCDEILASSVQIPTLTPKGLPIGNLTSQLWANIYLHELDHYAKHTLRVKNYVRYMDDVVVIHHDKDYLHDLCSKFTDFLNDELRLEVNDKTQVFPISIKHGRALDFLGYRIWPTHRLIRKNSAKRMTRSLKQFTKLYAINKLSLEKIEQSVRSWVAHCSYASSHKIRSAVLSRFRFVKHENEFEIKEQK